MRHASSQRSMGSFFTGYFDQQFRLSLFTSWASHLKEANISFRTDLARVEVFLYALVACDSSLPPVPLQC